MAASKARFRLFFYRHDAVMKWVLTHPGGKQKDCARDLGYSPAWVSKIINSPEFKANYRAITHRALLDLARDRLSRPRPSRTVP